MDENARDRQLAELNALLDVSRELGATIELPPLLQKVEIAVRNVLDCERATVFLYDKSRDELYSQVATGAEEIRFSARLGIAGEALHQRRLVTVPDAYADERFNPAIDRKTGFRTRNLLSFPMEGYDGSVVGVLQALNKRDGAFDRPDEQRASDLGALVGVAIQRQLLLDEFAGKQRLERDLALARDIQQRLLPKTDPSVEGYVISGWSKPADATGGDCYDYVPLEGNLLGILLADVTGHGIGPALIGAECRALIRALGSSLNDPAEILQRANVLLNEDLASGRFVTTFLGALDPTVHQLRYLSAGQGPLLHYRGAQRSCQEIEATTYPLGILPRLDDVPSGTLDLSPGDLVVLATDGFFEWVNPDDVQFGTQRVIDVIRECCDQSPQALIRALHDRVVTFGRGTPQADDLTIVVVKRQ